MITEHPIADLRALRSHFTGPQLEMTVASLCDGNTPGRLWTGEEGALLWDRGNNVFYLSSGGAATQLADSVAWQAVIAGPVRDAALAAGRRYFRTRGLDAAAEAALPTVFASVMLHPVRKRFHHFPAPAPPPLPEPSGVRFVPIDGVFLGALGLAGLDQVRREIELMWPAVSRFCERSFGVAALAGEAVIGWCTAEYVSTRACGIGIETIGEWQGRGVATAMARRFVRIALARNLLPHWECDVDNAPSLRVAEKLGFTRLEENTFQGGRF